MDVTEADGHVTLVIRDTGLGLAIVHRIVTAHGGTLEVDSTRDGTAFTMRIPSRF